MLYKPWRNLRSSRGQKKGERKKSMSRGQKPSLGGSRASWPTCGVYTRSYKKKTRVYTYATPNNTYVYSSSIRIERCESTTRGNHPAPHEQDPYALYNETETPHTVYSARATPRTFPKGSSNSRFIWHPEYTSLYTFPSRAAFPLYVQFSILYTTRSYAPTNQSLNISSAVPYYSTFLLIQTDTHEFLMALHWGYKNVFF